MKDLKYYKFRGKRIDSGQWVYGDLVTQAYPILPNLKLPIILDDKGAWEVTPESVGQFARRVDKFNREIYVGDILKINDKIMPVIFNDGCFRTPWTRSNYRLHGWGSDIIQVIGNIPDNPELVQHQSEE